VAKTALDQFFHILWIKAQSVVFFITIMDDTIAPKSKKPLIDVIAKSISFHLIWYVLILF
jgi:hypothetical protein